MIFDEVMAMVITVLLILPFTIESTNFLACLTEVQSRKWGSVGGTDNNGHLVSNISTAMAISYDLCV
jgi:hypothetical protein